MSFIRRPHVVFILLVTLAVVLVGLVGTGQLSQFTSPASNAKPRCHVDTTVKVTEAYPIARPHPSNQVQVSMIATATNASYIYWAVVGTSGANPSPGVAVGGIVRPLTHPEDSIEATFDVNKGVILTIKVWAINARGGYSYPQQFEVSVPDNATGLVQADVVSRGEIPSNSLTPALGLPCAL